MLLAVFSDFFTKINFGDSGSHPWTPSPCSSISEASTLLNLVSIIPMHDFIQLIHTYECITNVERVLHIIKLYANDSPSLPAKLVDGTRPCIVNPGFQSEMLNQTASDTHRSFHIGFRQHAIRSF